ncbi:Arm DNA-binding domain-containing protein [Mesobacillus zeae]|uniref:Core-binding (CB) domain-containing protein n=1 Tax=Mesobacillus zeae TaxID=1917180 RepID=A0A398AZ61_9BACI|nr:Arm DNA-binding domain-containing protein [Mesobacillus zeae]RID82897.1 hypothetical protein D1970_17535 [Mesobacillus zeae]
MKGHFRKRGCKCNPNNCICNKMWSFVIDVGKDPETGKRKQKSGSNFKTRQEAEAASAALITEVNKGTFIKKSDILFKDWANDWLPLYIERNGPKLGTIRLRQYSIKKLLPYFSYLKLKNITEEMYQSALNDLKGKNFSKSMIEGVHTTAKMIFKMAVSKRMLKIDPTTNAYIKKDEQIIIHVTQEMKKEASHKFTQLMRSLH